MEKKNAIYEGKAKILYATENPDQLICYYKDDATAGNGAKKGTIVDKGIMNNKITMFFFDLLAKEGISNHVIEVMDDRNVLIKKLDIVPLEVIIRNVAAGSLAKRLGLEEGTPMSMPVIELCYKNDDLGDPMVNRYHVLACKLASAEELDEIEAQALKINKIMVDYLKTKNIDLIDFKLEFGRDKDGKIIIIAASGIP